MKIVIKKFTAAGLGGGARSPQKHGKHSVFPKAAGFTHGLKKRRREYVIEILDG